MSLRILDTACSRRQSYRSRTAVTAASHRHQTHFSRLSRLTRSTSLGVDTAPSTPLPCRPLRGPPPQMKLLDPGVLVEYLELRVLFM